MKKEEKPLLKRIKKYLFIGCGIVAGLFLTIIIIAMIIPEKPSVQIKSIKNDAVITDESLEIKGKYAVVDSVKVNSEDAGLNKSKREFSKFIKLTPGDNIIKVEGIKEGKSEASQEIKVYFDLEGKLYQEKLEAEKKADEDELKERGRMPNYEVVRKENIDNGFSAIIYIDENEVRDYSVSNAIKDFRSKDENKKTKVISLLIFSKNDKSEIEATLEKDSDKSTLQKVSDKGRGDYEKNDKDESLFYFPAGFQGEKLALEVK
ncbi:MAG: hypothetical protein NTZ65_05045 [Candidatus Berkelbacteria bacterium]|nr:hypothetical protein [Candidatus Berkelbacteria bacterium]